MRSRCLFQRVQASLCAQCPPIHHPCTSSRDFHASSARRVIRPFLLSDPGEGIKEVQIIQWFIQPGARVEQFDKICEVASDKANVEITSRFDGVIKQLHYEQDDIVQVGKALLDIDVQSDITPENEALLAPEPKQAGKPSDLQQPQKAVEQAVQAGIIPGTENDGSKEKHAALATPAVRGLLKEKGLKIVDVKGTGREGRVLKEDIHRHVAEQHAGTASGAPMPGAPLPPDASAVQLETALTLTPTQAQMFKTMTRSLQIPHFLYADEIDITSLSMIRRRLNTDRSALKGPKLSYLPFIVKAVSLAITGTPILNARLSIPDSSEDQQQRPQLILRRNHNIGIAMDTAQGLLVPNIKNVAALSILDIAAEITRLQGLAKEGKLAAKDLTGGTFTVSNIGSIGGTYVAPVIVQSEVAILGIGKARVVPAFGETGEVVKKEIMNFSWSADHRVVDGATVARCAEQVRKYVEGVESMVISMR